MGALTRQAVFYVVLARHRSRHRGRQARVVGVRAYKPRLGRGECAVKVTIEVADECFDPVLELPLLAPHIGDVLRATGKAGG